jgi:hypothetical protein
MGGRENRPHFNMPDAPWTMMSRVLGVNRTTIFPSYQTHIPLSVTDLRKTDTIPAPEFYLELPFLGADFSTSTLRDALSR